MSQPPTEPPTRPEPDPAEVRRSKLIGRAIIIAFGLLLAAYAIPTFLNGR